MRRNLTPDHVSCPRPDGRGGGCPRFLSALEAARIRVAPVMWPLLLITSFGLAVCRGQTISEERRFTLTERAAVADGYRAMRAEVVQLPLGQGRTVADLAAESASIEIGIRRLVARSERVHRVRRYSGGDVEVDLRLALGPFVQELKKLQGAAQATGGVKPADLDALAERCKDRQIIVTGAGEPPTEAELTGPPGWPGGREAGDLPPAGWENVTAAGYPAAERMAELDAADHLVRQVAQLRMDRVGTVGDLIAAVPAIGQGLREPFPGIRVTKPEYLPEQVCRLYAETDVPAVIARLRQLLATVQVNPKVTEGELNSIARLATVRQLRAVGYGISPASAYRRDRYAVVDLDVPAWCKGTLRAEAKASLPRVGEINAKAVDIATQDARISAQLKLATQFDALELPGKMTVGDFLLRHDRLATDILTFLSSARLEKGPTVDKEARTVTLTLELRLERLWLILRDAIPATETTTKPTTR